MKQNSSNDSAGGVVVGKDRRIVVVFQHGNSWSLPKGHVEDGESLLDAAKREILEESGITDLEFVRELGSLERYSIGKGGTGENEAWGMRKRVFFLFKTKEESLVPRDREVTQARWATLDEALSLLTHPKDREFLASIRGTIEEL